MTERRPAEVFPPGEFIREELEERGWTQEVLAEILGTSTRLVNEVITAKRSITPETAQALGEAFGTSPTLWLNLESAYRLSRTRGPDPGVARRAQIYSKYPVREMCRRNWIQPTKDLSVLERRLCDYFETTSIEAEPTFRWPAWMPLQQGNWTPGQVAWATQARHMARQMEDVPEYDENRVGEIEERLRALLADAGQVGKVADVLAKGGIRLVVVEPIANTRIDGACLWLDEKSPVIALSMRHDRISAFWHPLLHEFAHLRHKDGEVVEDLAGERTVVRDRKDDPEARANAFAENFIIPEPSLREFARLRGPMYSTKDIQEFANELRVHPGLVVAQLHHRGLWDGSKGRKFLEKVRNTVCSSVPTDGWGCAPGGRAAHEPKRKPNG